MENEESLERQIQERFINLLKSQKEHKPSNAFGVYQKLVFYRYEEVIQNTFGQFCKLISKEEFDDTIYKFLQNPPKTTLVWQIAKDYKKFIKRNSFFKKKKYLNEILYFDWIELELFMKDYKSEQAVEFSWENSYILSDSARAKKFKHDIINGDFEKRRDNFLVIYYDFEEDEVYYREINELIYLILKSFDGKKSLEKTLKKFCKKYEIDFEEAKQVLEPAFTEFCKLSILKFK